MSCFFLQAADVDSEEKVVSDETEELEVAFLEKDLLQALQQEAAGAVAAAAGQAGNDSDGSVPHVHSDSCGSTCGHDHNHNHHHNHNHDHNYDHNHDHDHDHHHHHDQHNHSSEREQDHTRQGLSTNSSTVKVSVSVSSPAMQDMPLGAAERSKQHLLRAVKLLVQASAAGQAEVHLSYFFFDELPNMMSFYICPCFLHIACG